MRPAVNLHTSAAELGKFVHVLLNWGETADQLVIDPEYLSNMEHPRTSLAADAGLRNGYGSAIATTFTEGFPMLGHGGGIDGFTSTYAYSTSRDVGYVVMLNAAYSGSAMQRISQLAVRYLKADVEPPVKPEATADPVFLGRYRGYYHGANPRNQAVAFLEWLVGGQTISVDGSRLLATPMFGRATPLVPVSNTLFRMEADPEATRVFATDADGTMVLAGGFLYLERRSRWLVEIVRWPVLLSFAVVLTPLILVAVWIVHALVARRAEFVWLKALLLVCALAVALPYTGVMNVNDVTLGTRNIWTASMFLGTLALPVAAILALSFTVDAWRRGAGPWLRAYAGAVSISACILTAYLACWGMLAFRPWAY